MNAIVSYAYINRFDISIVLASMELNAQFMPYRLIHSHALESFYYDQLNESLCIFSFAYTCFCLLCASTFNGTHSIFHVLFEKNTVCISPTNKSVMRLSIRMAMNRMNSAKFIQEKMDSLLSVLGALDERIDQT